MTTFALDITTERLVEFNATINAICQQEIGRIPSVGNADDPVREIMMLMALQGRTGEQLREFLHKQSEAVTNRARLAQAEFDAAHPAPATPVHPTAPTPVHTTVPVHTTAAVHSTAITPPVRIRPLGPVFVDEHGTPVRLNLLTMFAAARRFANGEDLTALADETRALGFNGWRVFLRHAFIDWPAVKPFEMPIDRVRPFVDRVRAHGLYVELVVLCDTQPTFDDDSNVRHPNPLAMTLSEKIARVRAVLDAVRGADNVLVELMNEPPFNGAEVWPIADALGLPRAGDVPVASGDYDIIGHEAGFRVLDYLTNHIARKPSLPSEAAKDAHFIFRGWPADQHSPGFHGTEAPVVEDEPDKYGQDRGPSVDDAEDTGGGFALSAGGATFHTVSGISANPLSPREAECARRWAAAAAFVPATAPTGQYTHDGLPDMPLEPTRDAGEVVARLVGTTAYIVAAQPTPSYRPVLKPGWRITRRNARGNVLELQRT